MFNIKRPTNLKHFFNYRGISTMEILVVVAIIAIALTSLLGVLSFTINTSVLIKETNQANFLAQEAMEAVRNFRDGTVWDTDGLGVLEVNTAYHPERSGSPLRWSFPLPPDSSNGEEIIDGFTRKVVFKKVSRDPTTADIEKTYNSSHDDPDTRKVIVTVFWQFKGKEKNVELVTYLTNWKQ